MRNRQHFQGPPVGLFWDQSLVWGLLCIETLSRGNIPFRLISASDIAGGCLDAHRVLLVPGGWAAHKIRALGEPGKRRIADFLEQGGTYMGFCGGAGMALSSSPALYLTPIERMPLSERLPSASGRIRIDGDTSYPAWKNLPPSIPVSVWWPSQFKWDSPEGACCLGTYAEPEADFQVADLRVSEMAADTCWAELEKAYGINLDPAIIKGHPAIIETRKGKGRLVLSYAHLETPGDELGNRLFFSLIEYLNDKCARPECRADEQIPRRQCPDFRDAYTWQCIAGAEKAAADLIAFGEAHALWSWRESWLLNWRRGLRGLEYGTLAVSLTHMLKLREKIGPPYADAGPDFHRQAERLEESTREFCTLAKQLLLEEKEAAREGSLSKLGKVNDRVDTLRCRLFGNRMNHGGLCRALFDLIDPMLLDLLRIAHRA